MSKQQVMEIDVLNDYEFVLNGVEYTTNQFQEVFISQDANLFIDESSKYDIILRVHDEVDMETLQKMKVEFSKVKSHIDEIRYSREN